MADARVEDQRLPPHNTEAEEAVLGSILVEPSCLDDVLPILRPADFFREKNGWVYEAMIRAAGGLNQITVAQELAQKGRLEAIGGAGFLSLLVERLPSSVYAEHYARIVARCALYRRVITAAGHIARIGYEAKFEESELQARLRGVVDAITPTSAGSDLYTPEAQAETVMQIASDWQEAREGVEFGYPNLDRVTGGMMGGDLIVLGARTSVGKSQVLQEVALHNVGRQMPVLFASAEMSLRQLLEREIASATRKEIVNLRRGRATAVDWKTIGDLAQGMSTRPLHILAGAMTLEGVLKRARTLQESGGLSLVCFDHIQFVARKLSKQYGDSLREKVGYVTNALKSMAEELQVPVLAACQLSRQVENRDGHKPMLSDLQESGSIEQDADMVLLLHRPDLYDKCKSEEKGLLYIGLAKHRQGGREEVIQLRWNPRTKRYAPGETEDEIQMEAEL